MSNPLKEAFEFYLENQNEIVKEYDGKYVVIASGSVIGEFDSELEAIEEALKTHKPGTFLVQLVSSGDSAYTQNFHSRVAFS